MGLVLGFAAGYVTRDYCDDDRRPQPTQGAPESQAQPEESERMTTVSNSRQDTSVDTVQPQGHELINKYTESF